MKKLVKIGELTTYSLEFYKQVIGTLLYQDFIYIATPLNMTDTKIEIYKKYNKS